MKKIINKYTITSVIIIGSLIFSLKQLSLPQPITINQISTNNSSVSATFYLAVNKNCNTRSSFLLVPSMSYNTPPLRKNYSINIPTQTYSTLPKKLTISHHVPSATINKNNYKIGFFIVQKNNGKQVAHQTYIETRLNLKPTVQVNCQ